MITLFRKYTAVTVIAVCAAVAMGSCQLETSGNGDLDGMWHLVRVDTLATSGSADMGSEKIYWSFQMRLLQLDDKAQRYHSILFRFDHSGGMLRLYNPYVYDRENGDYILTDVEMLLPFGINSLDEVFTVESLKNGKMILRGDELRLSFVKY